jgi:RimJ/RimL family protein N-acetyltransferase
LLRLGLDVLGLRKVSAACHPANTASVRVLTKVGMRYEGRLSDHLYFRDQRQDRMIYAATA